MKSTVRTIILVAASVFAAVSCQKEAAVSEPQNPVNTGETIEVNINASLGDLVAADGTKATAESVVRLKWAEGDKVQAYCGTGKISTEGLTVTPSANGLFASLTGTIDAEPEAGEIITFVYSNVTPETGGLTFDFSSQTAEIPFVAYATLVYDGTATLTDKMVEFKFATSVMKIAATNLGGGTISNATISDINTKVKLTPTPDKSETFTIAGENKATITKTAGIVASSDGTRAIITVGLVPDNNTGRNITVTQTETGYTNKGVITSNAIEANKSYTTPTSLFTCGKIGEHDYVLIAGTKWATRNIGATGDAGENSYGTYFAWGDVTGQSPTDNAFDPGFSWNNCPWTNGTFSTPSNKNVFTKYIPSNKTDYWKGTDSPDNKITLDLADDAAHVKWGDTWRMPTSAEFKALKDATYWKWEDGGYYVYAPQSGDAGKKNSENGVTGTYNKSAALLFFPAAGYVNGTVLNNAGSNGNYWSSSLYGTPEYAYRLNFYEQNVFPQGSGSRYNGISVRPVSD